LTLKPGKANAGGLELRLQGTPLRQESFLLSRGGELVQPLSLRLGQHPLGDRLPVKAGPHLFHIHPHPAVGMESQQDQIAGMAHVELGPIGTERLAMRTDLDNRCRGRTSVPGTKQQPQASAAA
jgi:hypothetical protein